MQHLQNLYATAKAFAFTRPLFSARSKSETPERIEELAAGLFRKGEKGALAFEIEAEGEAELKSLWDALLLMLPVGAEMSVGSWLSAGRFDKAALDSMPELLRPSYTPLRQEQLILSIQLPSDRSDDALHLQAAIESSRVGVRAKALTLEGLTLLAGEMEGTSLHRHTCLRFVSRESSPAHALHEFFGEAGSVRSWPRLAWSFVRMTRLSSESVSVQAGMLIHSIESEGDRELSAVQAVASNSGLSLQRQSRVTSLEQSYPWWHARHQPGHHPVNKSVTVPLTQAALCLPRVTRWANAGKGLQLVTRKDEPALYSAAPGGTVVLSLNATQRSSFANQALLATYPESVAPWVIEEVSHPGLAAEGSRLVPADVPQSFNPLSLFPATPIGDACFVQAIPALIAWVQAICGEDDSFSRYSEVYEALQDARARKGATACLQDVLIPLATLSKEAREASIRGLTRIQSLPEAYLKGPCGISLSSSVRVEVSRLSPGARSTLLPTLLALLATRMVLAQEGASAYLWDVQEGSNPFCGLALQAEVLRLAQAKKTPLVWAPCASVVESRDWAEVWGQSKADLVIFGGSMSGELTPFLANLKNTLSSPGVARSSEVLAVYSLKNGRAREFKLPYNERFAQAFNAKPLHQRRYASN